VRWTLGNFPQNFCYNPGSMPRKIRELVKDLESAGFVNRGGKGDHRNFVHPKVTKPITISGKLGKDAKHYQAKAVQAAIEESQR
jgi:predicted RNA binding protein YcfA (HicA-like mRNA interferase family)